MASNSSDLAGEQLDFNDDGVLNVDGEVSLSGVPFSATAKGRDTIPAFTFDLLAADDPNVDHIEFVNTAWDEQLVDSVTSFLQATDLIDSAQAG